MSSIRLLKEREITIDGKPVKQSIGDVVSVSFGVGKQLIAEKVGVYPADWVEPAPMEAKRIEPKPVQQSPQNQQKK